MHGISSKLVLDASHEWRNKDIFLGKSAHQRISETTWSVDFIYDSFIRVNLAKVGSDKGEKKCLKIKYPSRECAGGYGSVLFCANTTNRISPDLFRGISKKSLSSVFCALVGMKPVEMRETIATGILSGWGAAVAQGERRSRCLGSYPRGSLKTKLGFIEKGEKLWTRNAEPTFCSGCFSMISSLWTETILRKRFGLPDPSRHPVPSKKPNGTTFVGTALLC